MKIRLLLMPIVAITFFVAMPDAHAANITDTGPGSFTDINNGGTLDYISITNSATIGNITNASFGTLNGNNAPVINTGDFSEVEANIEVDNSTVTGSIINNGAISQTYTGANSAAGILLSNASSVGGDITNNGTMTLSDQYSGAFGVMIDSAAGVTGNVTNAGTINLTNSYGIGILNSGTIAGNVSNTGTMTGFAVTGIINAGTITGDVTNAGTITSNGGTSGIYNTGSITGSVINTGTIAGSGYSLGIYNNGPISGDITNTGTIATAAGAAIANYGTAITVNQNAGSITGSITLEGSGSDTLNINGGTVTSSIYGTASDTVNFTGGTLILGNVGAGISGAGNYTQGAAANLVLNLSSYGASISATTINLGGTLTVTPESGGYLAPHTYTDIIDGGTLTGSFSSATNTDPTDYTISLTPDGGTGYDLNVTWNGGTGPHIADIGGGSFSDVNNTGTTNYIAVTTGGTIGNITNSSSGNVGGNATPYVDVNSNGITIAASLSVDGTTVTGNITNNGTISQSSDSNQIGGIVVANSSTIGGNITNNGTIALAASSDFGNYAYDIFIDSPVTVSGDVINNGTIITILNGAAGGAGINNAGTITGNLSNTGTINAAVNGINSFFTGIQNNYGAVTGNLTNSGMISATNISEGGFNGIQNFGDVTGSLINSGTISATGVDAYEAGGFTGIINYATITGGITNSGTITTTMTTYNSGIEEFAAGTGSPLSGDVINTGTISLASSNFGDGLGIQLGAFGDDSNSGTATLNANLTNSGTITVTAGINGLSYGISNQAFGQNYNATIYSNIINSGTIAVTAGAGGWAFGIYNTASNTNNVGIGAIIGTLTNSGTITATASGSGSYAYGLYYDNNGGANTITTGITNTGTITAMASDGGTAWAIFNQGNAMTIDQNAGFINGDVGLSGGDTFNIAGGTVTGSVVGNQNSLGVGDAVNVTGGTLVLPPTGGVNTVASYTQGASGHLDMQVTPSSAPVISATSISLGGALVVSPQGKAFGPSTTYTDVIAAGSSLSGSFSSVTTDASGFNASLTNDGGLGRDLTLTYKGNPGTAANVGNGAIAARGTMGGLTNTAQQRMLIGADYDTSGVTSLNFSNSGGGDIHMMVAGLDGAPIPSSMLDPANVSFWMRGFGSFSSAPAQGDASPFTQTRAGMIFGGDKRIDSHWVAGAAFQYAHTDLDFTDGSGDSRLNSYDLIGYGGWHKGPLYANGTVGAGWDHYDSMRNISGSPSATGSFNGQSYTASAETGYALPKYENWIATPYAGLGYTRVNTGSFTETGAGALDMAYQSSGSNSLASTLGLRLSTSFDDPNNGKFTPELHLGWQHEYLDEAQTVRAAFAATPGDVISADSGRYGRDTALVGFAITHPFSQSGKIFFTYDASITGGFTENAFSGGVRWEF